jgi:GH43 family beta-xylosidase
MIVYSASGSWEPTYKLGLLTMPEGADPMVPANWTKQPDPVMQSTRDVFGIGHCSFTTSVDGSQDWILFHSKKSRAHGWDRHVHAQRFGWTIDGLPEFGRPLGTGELRPVPATPAVWPPSRKAA